MDEVKPIILLLLSGLIIRHSLIFTGQSWAKSYSQTISFMILPIITYVITKTISGNIALSLGMIGALSIVRFRHPVKSAIELVIYFDLITLGIATSVRTKWAIQLLLCTVLVIILVKVFQKIYNKFNKSFYNLSFNEGSDLNTLEIESKEFVEILANGENLINLVEDKSNNKFFYRFGFANKEKLNKFKSKIDKIKEIEKINVNFN